MGLCVGIDLGSTFSVISWVNKDGVAEVIPNSEGDRVTPSVFAIDDSKNFLVGSLAVDYESTNPKNTVRLIKRQMSKGFEPSFVFNESVTLSPVQISSEILKKLVKDAEMFLGSSVTDAVITVPAYFNHDQRQSTRAAGEMAGLNVLRIINEPTAAAIAYGLNKNNDKTILVYDLGGGTFDVTILKLMDGVDFHVLSTAGNTSLGGADFDDRLAQLMLNKFNQQFDYDYNQNTLNDLDDSQRSRLRSAAEKSKKALSSLQKTTVNIPYFAFRNRQPVNLNVDVTKQEFEESIADLIEKTKDCILTALADSELKFSDIDEVVFVGGSTRLPIVFDKVYEWTKKRPNKSINPDEAISVGAALQASVLYGNSKHEIFLLDVTPLSLGIETQGGVMNVMIKRNSQVPSEYREIFTTAEDNQTSVDVKVFQGERPQTKYNHSLGQFSLTDIPKARRGVPKIEVIFDVDADGIVKVAAIDEATKNEKNMILSGSLSNEEMMQLIKDAEENKIEDERFRNLSNLRDWLSSLKIQLLELIDTKALEDEDINELNDLKQSIESDYHSENIELLNSLVESGKETIKNLSEKVYQKAKEIMS